MELGLVLTNYQTPKYIVGVGDILLNFAENSTGSARNPNFIRTRTITVVLCGRLTSTTGTWKTVLQNIFTFVK